MISECFLHCMDPGGDTGMALLHIQPDRFTLVARSTVPYRPRDGMLPTAILMNWLHTYPGPHRLVYEGFHIRPQTTVDPTALRVIGGVEQMIFDATEPYLDVFEHEPVQGKHAVTDEKLELLGLHLDHRHALRHERDALRHGVAYLIKRAYLPVCRAAYAPGAGRSVTPG